MTTKEQVNGKHENIDLVTFSFEKRSYVLCFSYYEGVHLLHGVSLRDDSDEVKQQELIKILYLNIGYCCIQSSWPRRASTVLYKALAIRPHEIQMKANIYFALGIAQKMMGDYWGALEKLHLARNLRPRDKKFKMEIRLVHHLQPSAIKPKENRIKPKDFDDEIYEE